MEISAKPAGEANGEDSACTVLFLLCPEQSAFNASFPLARKLKEKGYRVVYAGLDDFREHVQAQGFEYEALKPQNESTQQAGAADARQRRAGRWSRLRAGVKNGRQVFKRFSELGEQYLRAVSPAVVLLDPLIWRFSWVPLKCGSPVVSFSTALAGAFNPAVPPAFCDLQPVDPPGWRSRLRHALAWGKFIVPLWCQIMYSEHVLPWCLLLPPQRSTLARIRRAGGRIRWSEYGPRLDVPELVAAPQAFDFEAASTSNRIYLGACVDVSRDDGLFDWSWADADKSLLYCSLGTYSHVYQHARRLFDAVLAALKKREDIQAIVQVGTCAEVDAFGSLPDRIRVVKRAPQLEILARADIFVTHGGLSSVREAIYFGVPMLVFPCWNDQPGNAARIVRHGLGLKGDIAEVDERAMLRMLARITDLSTSNSMKRMQAHFRQQMDCQEGVELIESVIESGGHRKANDRSAVEAPHASRDGAREVANF
jgi:UDP:flavonoid glycosyltransferase YjiC (YdhE family)